MIGNRWKSLKNHWKSYQKSSRNWKQQSAAFGGAPWGRALRARPLRCLLFSMFARFFVRFSNGFSRIFSDSEDGIIEARESHRKSSQQHTQAGPKKYTKIANELKNNTHWGRREVPPPVGRRRRRRPIVFQFMCNICVLFGPSLCMLLKILPPG